jgi:DNA-binding CsgD family transcriptional regulator
VNDSHLDAIVQKLDMIAHKLDAVFRLGLIAMTQRQSQSEQIWTLSLAGLPPKQIAEFIGTTPNAVRVALFNLRRSRQHRRHNS